MATRYASITGWGVLTYNGTGVYVSFRNIHSGVGPKKVGVGERTTGVRVVVGVIVGPRVRVAKGVTRMKRLSAPLRTPKTAKAIKPTNTTVTPNRLTMRKIGFSQTRCRRVLGGSSAFSSSSAHF